jgi:hypothetical protein
MPSARALALVTICCLVSLEGRLQASWKQTALAAMTCISGPPWMPGNTCESISLAYFSLHRIKPAARPAQRLVRRGGHKIRVFNRAGMQPGRDQSRDVGDVRQQISPDFARNLAHALEINDARIGAGADGDHARAVFPPSFAIGRNQSFRVLAHAVMDDLKKFAGKIGLVAVGQMAAVERSIVSILSPGLSTEK